jgi:hypothetical protein
MGDEAVAVEAEPGIGRHHVVVAEQPQIEEQHQPEQRRPGDDNRSGEQGDGRDAKNEPEIEATAAQPACRWHSRLKRYRHGPPHAPAALPPPAAIK